MTNEDRDLLPLAILMSGIIIALSVYYYDGGAPVKVRRAEAKMVDGGYLLPHKMEEKMLEQMIELGVIDPAKLSEVTELNLLWAYGLSTKNRILDEGPMNDPRYGGRENFASTGGWNVAKDSAMEHYSMHDLVKLSDREQDLVEKVAMNTYRPCCRNSAYFPDCNHGLAMLSLLEILASDGASEEELVAISRQANNDWFPGYYKDWNGPVREKTGGGCSV